MAPLRSGSLWVLVEAFERAELAGGRVEHYAGPSEVIPVFEELSPVVALRLQASRASERRRARRRCRPCSRRGL